MIGLRRSRSALGAPSRQRQRLVEVPLVVAEVARVTDRVAVVRRLADDLEAARRRRARGTALRVCGVRRVVADVGDVVLVDLDPERVAEAHRVDLRPASWAAAWPRRAGTGSRPGSCTRHRCRSRPCWRRPAEMSPSLTLMRRIFPRRSFVFSVDAAVVDVRPLIHAAHGRRVDARRVGVVVPVRPVPSLVICGWSVWDSARRKDTFTFAVFTGPPVAWTLSAAMLHSASQRRVDRPRRSS